MFSIQLTPFNMSCENAISIATFNNTKTTSSFGCTPAFKWAANDYLMKLNDTILVQVD
jgi:hypothetical protein